LSHADRVQNRHQQVVGALADLGVDGNTMTQRQAFLGDMHVQAVLKKR